MSYFSELAREFQWTASRGEYGDRLPVARNLERQAACRTKTWCDMQPVAPKLGATCSLSHLNLVRQAPVAPKLGHLVTTGATGHFFFLLSPSAPVAPRSFLLLTFTCNIFSHSKPSHGPATKERTPSSSKANYSLTSVEFELSQWLQITILQT